MEKKKNTFKLFLTPAPDLRRSSYISDSWLVMNMTQGNNSLCDVAYRMQLYGPKIP